MVLHENQIDDIERRRLALTGEYFAFPVDGEWTQADELVAETLDLNGAEQMLRLYAIQEILAAQNAPVGDREFVDRVITSLRDDSERAAA